MTAILSEAKIYDDLAEFYTLWRDACLGKKCSEADEVRFLLDAFAGSTAINSIIDLGGGTGTHAIPLTKHGFDVTILDKSDNALAIARRNCSDVKTVQSSFETISLTRKFDASICMLSSFTYVLDEAGRRHLYGWMAEQTNDLMILDQGNFNRYLKTQNDRFSGEDKHFSLKVARDWFMEEKTKHTSFIYEFMDKDSQSAKVITDEQVQRYVPMEDLVSYLGKAWRLVALLGDYNLKHMFDERTSPRMICIFKRVQL